MNTYLKLTLRNLVRDKTYAAINIAGLAIAVCCCLIVALYLRNELTYDHQHPQYQRIYRVANTVDFNGMVKAQPFTSWVLGPLLQKDHPEITEQVRFIRIPGKTGRTALRYEDKIFYWNNIYASDESVFKVFKHHVIYGNPDTALSNAESIAISQSFARKYFGDTNPIGKVLTTDSGSKRIVALVFADLPDNTHLKYDVLFSLKRDIWNQPDNLNALGPALFDDTTYTYVVMPEKYDLKDFSRISDSIYRKYNIEGWLRRAYANSPELTAKLSSKTWHHWLQPIAKLHFQTEVPDDLPTGNRIYLYGFAAVGIFILLVACINYINLATARATRLAKTIGIRKILGAQRTVLMQQFLTEAVIFAMVAALLGIVFTELVLSLSPLNALIGKQLTLNLMHEPALLLWVFSISLVTGILSGLYPALYLSSWVPVSATVGRNRMSKSNIRFRQGLVLLQFTVSIAVIAVTLLMLSQMHYINEKSLGFAKENRIIINLRGADLIEQIPAIRNDLARSPHILGITTANAVMGETFESTGLLLEGGNNNDQILTTVNFFRTGDDFLKVMGLSLVNGRDFSKDIKTDNSTSIIVNESLVKKMGWSNPIGKTVQGNPDQRIIGVVKDFNFQSLHASIAPLVIYKFNDDFSDMNPMQKQSLQRHMIINVAGEDIRRTLALIEKKFSQVDTAHPFEFRFLDDSLQQLYKSEQQAMTLIGVFAGICVFIACLGLFGLAVSSTEQRTKEIGIRKVLGATTSQIILLLSRNILALVIAGGALASLIAYFAIDAWLAEFAYRTTINPVVFVTSTFVAVIVAYLTIALQSYKTATANPIKALRYE